MRRNNQRLQQINKTMTAPLVKERNYTKAYTTAQK